MDVLRILIFLRIPNYKNVGTKVKLSNFGKYPCKRNESQCKCLAIKYNKSELDQMWGHA